MPHRTMKTEQGQRKPVAATSATSLVWRPNGPQGSIPGLPLFLQPKLAISQPDDSYEQEADQVAEQVMRMPEPAVQRKCAACVGGGGPPCPKCEEEAPVRVSRKAQGATRGDAPALVDSVLRVPGQPLGSSTRAFFEPRFGRDLGDVRIHTGSEAEQTAEEIAATAYTLGSNIGFARGEYDPSSSKGKRLLAHELTHVIQQSHATTPVVQRAGDGDGEVIEGAAPPPNVPSWYQHKSNATSNGDTQGTIYFGTDQDSLTPDDDATIDEVMKKWEDALQSGDWQIEVYGYADQRADEAYNDDLASRRAWRVYDELSKRAPMPEGSGYITMGEEASSSNPDDLARKRRVEIRIVPKRKHDKKFPPPPIPPPPPFIEDKQVGWSTEWQFKVLGGGNAGVGVGGGEIYRIKIENMKTHESMKFTYTGGGLGWSAIPIGLNGPGGPYGFKTTKPCPLSIFRTNDNGHLNLGANAPTPGGKIGPWDIPNGYSGEVWLLTGPMTIGAELVVVNASGGSFGTPNAGISGTMGPLW